MQQLNLNLKDISWYNENKNKLKFLPFVFLQGSLKNLLLSLLHSKYKNMWFLKINLDSEKSLISTNNQNRY